jgi:hypothetical protein
VAIESLAGGPLLGRLARFDVLGQVQRYHGLVPGVSTLANKRLTLGYREARACQDSPIARAGQMVRGHEFHWSVCDSPSDRLAAYEIMDGSGRVEGYAAGNILASYVHVHFASDPGLAPRFVAACAGSRPQLVVLGVGCTSDASPGELEALACAALRDAGLSLQNVGLVATIDKRVSHPAVIGLAQRTGVGLRGFSPDELAIHHTGTPSVCEAAALLASSRGSLVVPKRKSARATVAVAIRTEKS